MGNFWDKVFCFFGLHHWRYKTDGTSLFAPERTCFWCGKKQTRAGQMDEFK